MFYFKRCVAVAMLVCCYTSQAQPVAAFAPGRHKVCSGSTVTLTNQSTGSHAYKWFINEVFYSSSVNDSVVLFEPCYDLQSIKLVLERGRSAGPRASRLIVSHSIFSD